MKSLFFSLLFLFSSSNIYAQPAKKFGYELKIIAKSPNANGNFYPGDEFKLVITPVNPELWDGKKRYFSLIDYISIDNEVKQLLPADDQSPTDFVLTGNQIYTIENITIDETTQKGLEYLILFVSEVPISFNINDRSGTRSGNNKIMNLLKIKDELLLLVKGSQLSSILAASKKDSSFMFSTIAFNVWPKESKSSFSVVKNSTTYSYISRDSTELFESAILKDTLNRNDFPIIAFIDPGSTVKQISDSLSKMSLNKVVLKGIVRDDQNGIKQITINGEKPTLYVDDNGLFEFKYTLRNGVNELMVTAENNLGNKKTYRLRFNYTEPQKRNNYTPKNYLLVFGINNYSLWPKLKNAKSDAERFRNLMVTKYGFKSENVIPRYDGDATFQRMYDEFLYLKSVIQPEDNLLVYYAGHGIYNERESMGFWIPVEAKKYESTTFFPNILIGKIIREIKAKNIFIISDACYSGALFNEATFYNPASKNDATLSNTNFKTRLILTSGGYEKVPDKSIFAEKVYNKLSSPATKQISARELIEYIKKEFANSPIQKPNGGVLIDSYDEDGDFILTKY